MPDASLTNLQMVRPKGPKIFLAVLGLGVVGAGAWWLTRAPGPVGEPEDPRKLLVVGGEDGIASTLGELGFIAEQGSFDELAAKGSEAGASGEGIEAILHFADTKGFGYVAVEDPLGHGLTGLKVSGDSTDVSEDDEWAVFSVGELGMPPKATVEQRGSVLELPGYVHVLRAAFVQDRLANTLFADNQLPMDAVELQPKIKDAIELFGAYQMLDRRLDKQVRARDEAVVSGESIEPKPAVLADTLELSESFALADGTVLSMVQGQHLDEPWDAAVRLAPDTELTLWYQPAGSTDPAERQRCESLRGGVLPLSHGHRVLSPRGDALLLESGGGIEVWTLDVAAAACKWQRAGKLPEPRAEELSWGLPDGRGHVLRAALTLDGPAVHVWEPGQQQPLVVAAPGCSEISAPVWLDQGHVAFACHWQPPVVDDYAYDDEYDPYAEDVLGDEGGDDEGEGTGDDEAVEAAPPPPPEQVWIYVVRLSDQRAVAVPGSELGEHVGNYGLMAMPGSGSLDLLAVHPWDDQLLRVRSKGDLAALFAAAEPTFTALVEADAQPPEAAPSDAEPTPPPSEATEPGAVPDEPVPELPPEPVLRPAFAPVGSMVAALDDEALRIEVLTHTGDHDTLALSLDGSKLVYVTHDGRSVQVLDLDDKVEATVSNSTAGHEWPRFTADGKGVVFTSHYQGTDRSEHVGRLALLP